MSAVASTSTAPVAPPKKKPEEVVHPLLKEPVPHAYALIPDPKKVGHYFAVHLTGVIARGLTHLEPGARSAAAPYGLQRIGKAMERRHVEKRWSK
jgi:hypothetical protein